MVCFFFFSFCEEWKKRWMYKKKSTVLFARSSASTVLRISNWYSKCQRIMFLWEKNADGDIYIYENVVLLLFSLFSYFYLNVFFWRVLEKRRGSGTKKKNQRNSNTIKRFFFSSFSYFIFSYLQFFILIFQFEFFISIFYLESFISIFYLESFHFQICRTKNLV